mmetsp:Transcript_27814/g.75668  ORF Transcript_27814/g.75668 Transcript_27814/m.75668 type:complete len:565 (-) Transcript_27814:230-1924(-)|eukprot:CAMPEP_0172358040 /NCGR_PEP_ID=MMETSP1060-20121228/2370_1 /TAXON_ID=37318 /ORGANISM="Pseudo-nitzschia pungens, Strain cf. cingulata" /LENGTH=564 /DNA_ID=CAMNT_0013079037 /DNA_START=106 /DNA_END=1800 /DNA_ORIENTATION=-
MTDPKFSTWTFDDACASMSPLTPLSDVELLAGPSAAATAASDADLVFVCHFSSPEGLGEASSKLDEASAAALSLVLEEHSGEYKNGAKLGSTTPTVRVFDSTKESKSKSTRYVLVGLGEKDAAGAGAGAGAAASGRAIGGTVVSKCKDEASPGVNSVVVLLPGSLHTEDFVRELSIAVYSGLYDANGYRGTLDKIHKIVVPDKHLQSVALVTYGDDEAAASGESAVDEAKSIVGGVHIAKDIVNAPHNVLNSLSLADLAKTIAAESKDGCITCNILDKDDCEKRGMGAYLGVARASETPPQFIHLTYKSPEGTAATTTTTTTPTPAKKLGLVGKGLLFDTGGYNIKTAMMELMKFDCGGAAAVLGAARAVGALQPPGVECHFVVAACENMINDRGVVPSDVLVASNGVTIEILNTDAEGRLTLADALVYCDKELGCEKIIELSTLTGSCMVALGKEVCAVLTENDDLAKELESVSEATGESSWRLPLVKSYEKQLKSNIADIKNCGTRWGGTITAGLFLQHFVDTKTVPFAHIDIAGPVWDDSSGATGFGSKLVTEWIRRQGQE